MTTLPNECADEVNCNNERFIDNALDLVPTCDPPPEQTQEHDPPSVTPFSNTTEGVTPLLSNGSESAASQPEEAGSDHLSVPCSLDNVDDKQEIYILQVATVPGSLAKVHSFSPNKTRHRDFVQKEHISKILSHYKVNYEVLVSNGFSCSENWGLEPNCYIRIKATERVAYGAAALFGAAFDQEAVGLVNDRQLNKAEEKAIRSGNPEQLNAQTLHRMVKLAPYVQKLISPSVAYSISAVVQKEFPAVGSQVSHTGTAIEFHDYSGKHDGKFSAALLPTFNGFQSEETYVKSALIESEAYDKLMRDAGFTLCVRIFQMCRDHTMLFHQNT